MEDTQVIENPEVKAAEPSQEVNSEQVSQEVLDITKDPRWDKDWKKDINNVYKALKGYDKSFTPVQMALKKYGIADPTALEKVLEEYKTYTNPEGEVSRLLGMLDPIAKDPADIEWFQKTVQDKLAEIRFRGLDKNLPPEIKQAIMEGKEAKQKADKLEEELEVSKIRSEISSNLTEIKKYAKDNELEFNEAEFLNYCKEKNVPANLLMDVFQAKAKPFIVNNETRKAEENVLTNIEKAKKGGISTSSKSSAPVKGKEGLGKALDRILGIN